MNTPRKRWCASSGGASSTARNTFDAQVRGRERSTSCCHSVGKMLFPIVVKQRIGRARTSSGVCGSRADYE